MMYQGHIDISRLQDWHLKLQYTAHYNPLDGFNFGHISDSDRYDSKLVTVHLARELSQDISDFFFGHFCFLQNPMICVQKMLPGMILPTHTDKFTFFKKTHEVTDINRIMRIIVFLQNWQSGHISEIDNRPNTLWKAGDWISWFGETPHMAANIGHTDRYTLQITGMVNKPLTIS